MPTPREAYTNSVQREGYSNARTQAADFGAAGEMIGKAAQGFGQDLKDVSKNIDEVLQKDAEISAQEAFNVATKNRLGRLYKGETAYFNQKGGNAVKDRGILDADLQAIDDDVKATLLKTNPRARHLFDQAIQRRNAEDTPRIELHAEKGRGEHADAVDASTLDTATDEAASTLDPVKISGAVQTARDIGERQSRKLGLSTPEQIRNAQETYVGPVIVKIATQMNLKSPRAAQVFALENVKHMDPDDAASLLGSLAGPAAQDRARSADLTKYTHPELAGGAAPSAPRDPLAPLDDTPAPTSPAQGAYYPAAASGGTTPIPPEAALDVAQWTQESGNRHVDAKGRMITSSAGAKGISQVMQKTGVDPGYGITPLRNNSREEYIRFGKDYREAMLKKYNGNIVLALTAYNWGPGNVDAHIKSLKKDPSKGQISDAAFLNSIGNKEAREYAARVLSKAGTPVSGNSGVNTAAGVDGGAVPVGEDFDLKAAIQRVTDDKELTFVEREAYVTRIKELHGISRQIKADAEDATRDEVAAVLNGLPVGGFTDYEKQIPLEIRMRMPPAMALTLRTQAHSNAETIKNGRESDAADASVLAINDLWSKAQENTPDGIAARRKFMEIEFVTAYPEISAGTKTQYMGWQTAVREAVDKPGKVPKVDHGRIAALVNNNLVKMDKGNAALLDAGNRAVRLQVDRWFAANPKALFIPDVELEGITRRAMLRIKIDGKSAYGFEQQAGQRAQVDPHQYWRSRLMIRDGREPTPDMVQAAVDLARRNGM